MFVDAIHRGLLQHISQAKKFSRTTNFKRRKPIVNVAGFADPSVTSRMTDFKASVVAFEVQKNFANKFFSNKVVVKGLIDDTSAKLLDNLYNLLFVFVSRTSFFHVQIVSFFTIVVDEEQEGLGEDDEEHHQDVGEDRDVAEGGEVHQGGEGQLDHDPEDLADGGHDFDQLLPSGPHLRQELRHQVPDGVGVPVEGADHQAPDGEVRGQGGAGGRPFHPATDLTFPTFQIFGVVKTAEFLDSIYVPGKSSEMRELMGQVVADLNNCLEAGIL